MIQGNKEERGGNQGQGFTCMGLEGESDIGVRVEERGWGNGEANRNQFHDTVGSMVTMTMI